MNKVIAILVFVGGAAVIRSMLTPTVSMPYLIAGGVLIVVALALFVKEISKI